MIGATIDPALLTRVSGAGPSALEECLACGILVTDGERLGFRHELTRAAVEEAISPPRRALLHATVAQAIATTEPSDHARIAHHAAAGRLDGLAAEHASEAAAEAERVGSFREALAQRERALACGGAESRTELLLAVGSVAWLAEEPQRAREALEEVVVEAERAADPLLLGRALRRRGRTFWLLDRWDDAAAAARRSIEVIVDTRRRRRARGVDRLALRVPRARRPGRRRLVGRRGGDRRSPCGEER